MSVASGLRPRTITMSTILPSDTWRITRLDKDTNRRVTIQPTRIEVTYDRYDKARIPEVWSIHVSGRLIRQSDGVLTGNRRALIYAFPDDDGRAWSTVPKLGEDEILDPEIMAFAYRTRRMIEAAVAAEEEGE